MKKHLFFDDRYLFVKENTETKMGVPTLCAKFYDGTICTPYPEIFLFRTDDGKYRLLYGGRHEKLEGLKLFCATSDDGINFTADRKSDEEFSHEVKLSGFWNEGTVVEIANMIEDKNAPASERYKLLSVELDKENLQFVSRVHTSPDLCNWTKKQGAMWADGAEPLTGVFYNEKKNCFTVLTRPDWCVRSVDYRETKDWINYTEPVHCMDVDSLDDPLAEIYGMYAFDYHGMYIGIPHVFANMKSEHGVKYTSGTMETQLAYSYDGRYWQRSLRSPFISGLTPEKHGDDEVRNLLWAMQMSEDARGDIVIYATSSLCEHGDKAFSPDGEGRILIYKLRSDGFVYLESKDKEKESVVATREKIWHGGDLHCNLCAKNATVAIYNPVENADGTANTSGTGDVVPGMSHEDCIAFSGDSTDWIPQYKSGKTLDELAGKTVVVEIKFTDGKLYSFGGEYEDVFSIPASRYRRFGTTLSALQQKSNKQ